MRPFRLERATDPSDAVGRFGEAKTGEPDGSTVYCAGGTTVVDLMKLDVLRPERLIDLLALRSTHAAMTPDDKGLDIGALATMSEVAAHPDTRARYTAVASAIDQSASAQLRNVATIGGNLLQRTRCPYFRDGQSPCNKREPGAGCSAIGGETRGLAILGTSEHCVANYPGDLAVALVAFDAVVTVLNPCGETRAIAVEDLYRLPGDRPDLETHLKRGDLITSIRLPRSAWQASAYVKVRDRASYAFALASAAVALRLDGESRVEDVRIVLGGLAAKPWRCRDAELALRGRAVDDGSIGEVADLCLAGARVDDAQAFKVELGRRTAMRALLDAAKAAG